MLRISPLQLKNTTNFTGSTFTTLMSGLAPKKAPKFGNSTFSMLMGNAKGLRSNSFKGVFDEAEYQALINRRFPVNTEKTLQTIDLIA